MDSTDKSRGTFLLTLGVFACSAALTLLFNLPPVPDKAAGMARGLPPAYDCYQTDPGPEARVIFQTCYNDLDETARIQGKREPASIAFLLRRRLPFAGWHAKTPENVPFANEAVPYYMQWDQRWAFDRYAGDLFGESGCGPTALSMVYEGVTGSKAYPPDRLGRFALLRGFARTGIGTSWALMTEGARELGLEAEELPLDEGVMTRALAEGKPLILAVGPGDFTSSGHFIVCRSCHDGRFAIYDPFSYDNSLKYWSYETLAPQIRNIWAYTKC